MSGLNRLIYLLIPSFIFPFGAQAAEPQRDSGVHGEEEVIVTSIPLAPGENDTALPVNILSGQALRENTAATLGDTLSRQMGVTSSSFGAGVGKPVIRGQSSNRVRVLENGTGALDASAVSPDHANAVEPLIATQLEVIRGPATLLYGNGAIGGVVNVVDNRVPETIPDATGAAIELRHNTVNHGDTAVAVVDGGAGTFAWHLDGTYRNTGDVSIPGLAATEQGAGNEENTRGFIRNSDLNASGFTAGGSWVGSDAFVGFSINRLNNNYGLPPGVQEGTPAEPVETENVRLDMEQTRYDLKGGLNFDGFWNSLDLRLNYTDYQHKEIENTVFPNGETTSQTGTVFSNEGLEGRATLKHLPVNNWQGVLGTQVIDRTFGAQGEEAFIPEADIRSAALFIVESLNLGTWVHEFGLRGERQTIEPATCQASSNTWSASASSLWNFRDDANVMLAVNRSERAPTVEELFSNVDPNTCMPAAEPDIWVQHAATGLYEIGDSTLNNEQSTNMEIGFRKYAGDIQAEVNIYYNKISDYIYLQNTGEEFTEAQVAYYAQSDATFNGLEAEFTAPLFEAGTSHIDLTLFADFVRARFDSGENTNVPRIPPRRAGVELAWIGGNWTAKLRTTVVAKQDDTAEYETPTDGYTLMSLYVDYTLPTQVLNGNELSFFIKGNNLLDEEIRNHTSFIKDYAPEPGRGFELGLRYKM